MPNWKKVIVSGSNAILASLKVPSVYSNGSVTTGTNVVTIGTDGQVYMTGSYSSGGASGIFLETGSFFATTNDLEITGSLIISASNTSQSLSVIGSGSTVFEVIGSEGTLLAIDDDLDGILLTANNASGNPSFAVSASGEVYIGQSPQSLYTTAVISSTTAATTQSIYGLNPSSYDGAFFDYTVQSGSDARAGSIMSVWSGSNINFTETTTLDIGDTTDFNLIVHISQSQAQIASHASRAGYNIKTIIRSI
tara:strand:+ start:337 stop:1089 length:753 start_codon:yes stop_codon:yes gene_type:complete